jgi:hypothetical protein
MRNLLAGLDQRNAGRSNPRVGPVTTRNARPCVRSIRPANPAAPRSGRIHGREASRFHGLQNATSHNAPNVRLTVPRAHRRAPRMRRHHFLRRPFRTPPPTRQVGKCRDPTTPTAHAGDSFTSVASTAFRSRARHSRRYTIECPANPFSGPLVRFCEPGRFPPFNAPIEVRAAWRCSPRCAAPRRG